MLSCLLITGDDSFSREVGLDLQGLGVDVLVQPFGAEVAAADVDFAVVRNAAGAEGLQQTFFAVRSIAAATSTVIVLDIGLDEVDSGSLSTLVDGLVKALPATRLALLTDRLGENIRPTGGRARVDAAPDGDAVARAALALAVDSHWSTGHRVYLPGVRLPVTDGIG